MGGCVLLQGIFLTQVSDLSLFCLLHCGRHQGFSLWLVHPGKAPLTSLDFKNGKHNGILVWQRQLHSCHTSHSRVAVGTACPPRAHISFPSSVDMELLELLSKWSMIRRGLFLGWASTACRFGTAKLVVVGGNPETYLRKCCLLIRIIIDINL